MGIWLDDAERDQLREALGAVWPTPPAPVLTWLNEGFGSAAFTTEDGLLVLVAKNARGAHSRRVTIALTPALAPLVAVAVPVPVWSIEEAPGLPHGAYAYPKLPGRKMTEEDAAIPSAGIARRLGTFLSAIHSIPVSRALSLGVPDFADLWQDLDSLRSATDATVQRYLKPEEHARVRAWWDAFFQDEALLRCPRCLVHGDLWPHNMLVDEAGMDLLGIIDFGDVQVIDPAYDFAPLRLSRTLFDGALRTYQRLGGVVDAGFEHRLQRWWELRSGSWFSLRAAVRAGDAEELEDSLQQLRRSPILTPARLGKW